MIKIFVHEISYKGDGCHDLDRDYYVPIYTSIHIYSNKEKLNFSDIRYWRTLEDIKKHIEICQEGYKEYGYTGDFDKNGFREKSNNVFAKEICDKLNKITDGEYFEVYDLKPFKETQRHSWDRNLYYNPKDTECCYDITDLFLKFPGIDKHYQQFLNSQGCDKVEGEIFVNSYPFNIQVIIRERKIEWQLQELKKELEKIKTLCHINNIRVNAFCRFIVPYIENNLSAINDPINIYPSSNIANCYFVEKSFNFNLFYPLNIALELGEKKMIHTLIEYGAYKLADGSFIDTRNRNRRQKKHSIDYLLKTYCDEAHSKMLKKNLKQNAEWNDELEMLYPD